MFMGQQIRNRECRDKKSRTTPAARSKSSQWVHFRFQPHCPPNLVDIASKKQLSLYRQRTTFHSLGRFAEQVSYNTLIIRDFVHLPMFTYLLHDVFVDILFDSLHCQSQTCLLSNPNGLLLCTFYGTRDSDGCD